MLRMGSELVGETSLGAAYGSSIGDAMTFVHVTELGYRICVPELSWFLPN